MNYAEVYNPKSTDQNKPIPGRSDQVKNNAGGYVFGVDDMAMLHRFLILGSESATYYCSRDAAIIKNAKCVQRCIEADGIKTVNAILDVSFRGLAPKNDPAVFALAMCAGAKDVDVRRYATQCMPKVCRTGTDLFLFMESVKNFRGRGKTLQRSMRDWYLGKAPEDLAYQVVKYQNRNSWSHRDVLRLAKPGALVKLHEHSAIFEWITKGSVAGTPPIIHAYEEAKTCDRKRLMCLIAEFGLTREMIPTKWQTDPGVWGALLEKMPLTAMIRNLATMTRVGLLTQTSSETSAVIKKLGDSNRMRVSRVHPAAALMALGVYASGHSVKGDHQWIPVQKIIDALDEAFYAAFANVGQSNTRTMLAVDVSGSMDSGTVSGTHLSPRAVAAAMAMVAMKANPNYHIMGFSDELVDLPISPRQRLDQVAEIMRRVPMGGTNCALPMVYAAEANEPVDMFIVYTDNETRSSRPHPVQVLEKYRQKTGINAKLVVVAITSTGFTIADPKDPGTMDVVGFDASAPQAISEFSRG